MDVHLAPYIRMAEPFEKFQTALKGKPLSHIWRGHGSALFLEFGKLREVVSPRSGKHNFQGDYSIMIEWSWRVEGETSILGGSWSDEQLWPTISEALRRRFVHEISVFGKLPELLIQLSGNVNVVTFMTAEGQPQWTIFENIPDSEGGPSWITVEDGRIVRQGRPD